MYKTKPFVLKKVWGQELWLLSAMEQGNSLASPNAGGEFVPLERITGKGLPILVKILEPVETLSVQVHPDDEYARIHENCPGKAECWYVLEAEPDSELVCGLNADYTRNELEDIIKKDAIASCLKKVRVRPGDFLYLPAGTVHEIFGGIRLLEVQQPSDITYRLYDWNRGREIHVAQSLDVIRHIAPAPESPFCGRFECEFFGLEKLAIRGEAQIHFEGEKTPAVRAGWGAIFVIEGEVQVLCEERSFTAARDELILLDAKKIASLSAENAQVMKIF